MDATKNVVVSAAAKMHQNESIDHRRMFTASHENAMMKQIQNTHYPDQGSKFDVKPLLYFVEDILLRATTCIPGIAVVTTQAQPDPLDDKALQNGVIDKLKFLAGPINKISCEISCKHLGGSDPHATTVALLNTLSSYSWDAKVVIALAAFAGNYGEFWLVAQLYPNNPPAKSVALLKQLPYVVEHADSLKLKFGALTNLIMAMLNVTKCIVELKELSSQYTTPGGTSALLTAPDHIPSAVYLIIRSIVTCASQIMNFIGVGNKYTPTAESSARELSNLEQEIRDIHGHLQSQLDLCYQIIAKRRLTEAYEKIVHVFQTAHVDNMRILEALIYAEGSEESQLTLFHGTTKRQVSIDLLRKKYVLLLISDLDSSHEEISILEQMYNEKPQHPTGARSQYEVVWLHVEDTLTQWNDDKKKQFWSVQASMPWHSVANPSPLPPAVNKYIKEVWHYNKKPLLVVLDPRGRVVNANAIQMMCIWRNFGFPFTSEREASLWEDVTWTFELLVGPLISRWIRDEKHICFYGGADIKWIREFTTIAKEVAEAAGIQMEMLYLGKSKAWETVQKNNEVIVKEDRGHILSEENLNRFWVVLEGMWHLKMQHGKSVEDDAIMKEITAMLSFDGSDKGWAIICRGSAEMAKAKGDAILSCLSQFHLWKDVARQNGFVYALNLNLEELHLHTTHHCNCLILAGTTGSIPQRVICADCKRPMEKFVMYRCRL